VRSGRSQIDASVITKPIIYVAVVSGSFGCGLGSISLILLLLPNDDLLNLLHLLLHHCGLVTPNDLLDLRSLNSVGTNDHCLGGSGENVDALIVIKDELRLDVDNLSLYFLELSDGLTVLDRLLAHADANDHDDGNKDEKADDGCRDPDHELVSIILFSLDRELILLYLLFFVDLDYFRHDNCLTWSLFLSLLRSGCAWLTWLCLLFR